jgi:SAM-dependent methyltransferase
MERRRIWQSKEILKRLYSKWYGLIADALRTGNILELGSGSGNLKEFFPNAISSDILFAPWLDAVLDAHGLPFKDESLDSIVLFDVLHHLNEPALLFGEADRVLKQYGRIILMEPYVSWSSFLVYQFLHREGMTWSVDPFNPVNAQGAKDPFSGNQAVSTLIFEKYWRRFIKNFPRLKVIRKERMDFLMYPLSGGFHNPSLCPPLLWNPLEYMERLLKPLNRYLAFRLFLVIEKSG